MLRITKKNFQSEEWPHELFLSTRQKIKITNAFASNMSTDIKLNKAHLFKIIQSEGAFGASLGKFAGSLVNHLDKIVLALLATIASASAIDGAIQRKICERDVARTGRGITLVISNEDMEDIIRFIEPLENSGALLGRVRETVNPEMERQEGGSLSLLLETLDG